ncbi:MAG: hypothetical protein ACXAC7_23095 [Candidatus Hodarchaeales archaeon]|jgi:hypothetical protein
MSPSITLVCEACPIEGKVIAVTIKKDQLKPSITGVSTIIDLHGLDDQAKGVKPHVRILYVDERLTVRSFSVVTSLAKRKTSNTASDEVVLTCEACPVEGKVIPVSIRKSDFKPSITGVSTIVDLHGIDEEAKAADHKKHCRILYVDERLSVRSFTTVTALAKRK